MSAPSQAVFLSYASQDAAAARKICEALRQVGIEVWFDVEGGLEHGDAWDRKIRGQIRDCVLFIPVISANTQARSEGYFRIEWDLAAERARGIAGGVPFILPFVVDATRETEALVPDRFLAVQWARLPSGDVPPEIQTRILKLWSQRVGTAQPERELAGGAVTGSGPGRSRRRRLLAGGAAAALALLAGLGVRTLHHPAPTAGNPDLEHARQLIYALDPVAEDVVLAEGFVKPLLTAHPTDPDVATAAAEVSWAYIERGFDASEERATETQHLAERAVQLAPNDPAALETLGAFLSTTRTQNRRAEDLLGRAIAGAPNEPRAYCALCRLVTATKPASEVAAFRARMLERFPHDARVDETIAQSYLWTHDLAAAEHGYDETLAIAPLSTALVAKARIMLEVHGDIPAMARLLDQLPERQRTNGRMLNAFVVQATVTGKVDAARHAVEATGDAWLNDGTYVFPRSLLLAQLDQIAGNADIARVEYGAALKDLRARQGADSLDLRMMRVDLWVQLGLGDRERALAALRMNLQRAPRPYHWSMGMSWWTSALRAAWLLGEHDRAITLLTEACATAEGRLLLRNLFQVDPLMAPFRHDPIVEAQLAAAALTGSAR